MEAKMELLFLQETYCNERKNFYNGFISRNNRLQQFQ